MKRPFNSMNSVNNNTGQPQADYQTDSAKVKCNDCQASKSEDCTEIQRIDANHSPDMEQNRPSIDVKNTQRTNHGRHLQNKENDSSSLRGTVIFRTEQNGKRNLKQ